MADTYTLTYNANGGGGAPPSQQGGTITVNTSGPSVKRTWNLTYHGNGGIRSNTVLEVTGEFNHWNTKSDGSGDKYGGGPNSSYEKTVKLTGNLTLYAIWDPPAVGSCRNAKPGEDYGIPSALPGYVFQKWTKDAAGYERVYAGTLFPRDGTGIDLYAQWEYQITYKVKRPTDTRTTEYVVTTSNKEFRAIKNGDSIDGSTVNLICPGYNFTFWNNREDGSGVTHTPGARYSVQAPLTLYATYVRGKYYVYRWTGTEWVRDQPIYQFKSGKWRQLTD